jgi:hypothetical protein
VAFANDCVESGYTNLRDVQNLTLDQKTEGELEFILHDPRTGTPIDLTSYASSSSSPTAFTGVKLTLKEMPEDCQQWATQDLDVVDATAGTLSLTYDENFTRRAGIFTAQVELWDGGIMRRVIPYFVTMNPNLLGDPQDRGLALSVAEIRMTIRDTDPQQNTLLEDFDFSDQEIALAVRRCVDYWNEVPPDVAFFKATNFPWRYHLSLGAAAVLHQMAANQKMRNDLPYQAGGLTVQDTIKFQQYLDFYKNYWGQWAEWVKRRKYAINVNGAYMSLNSGYAYDFFYR